MTSRIGWGPKPVSSSSIGKPSFTASTLQGFERAEKTKVKVKEASDVVSLGQGRFLVVSDESDSLGVVGTDGKLAKVKLDGLKNGQSGLEGVAYDPLNKRLFVANEEKNEILRYAWDGDAKSTPTLEKTIKLELDGPKNKGIEGLCFMPGELSVTGRPQLLAVKEGEPQQLMVLDQAGQGSPVQVKLEQQVLDVCHDFSGLTIDPKSGHVFICSDESSTVAELELRKNGSGLEARLVRALPLRDGKDKPLERVEGITFDEAGDLHVMTENDGALHRLKRMG